MKNIPIILSLFFGSLAGLQAQSTIHISPDGSEYVVELHIDGGSNPAFKSAAILVGNTVYRYQNSHFFLVPYGGEYIRYDVMYCLPDNMYYATSSEGADYYGSHADVVAFLIMDVYYMLIERMPEDQRPPRPEFHRN